MIAPRFNWRKVWVGFVLAASAWAGGPAPSPSAGRPVPSPSAAGKFGFYPIRLYELAPEKSLFSVDFYFWVSVPAGTFSESKLPTFEAANGEKLDCESIEYNPVEKGGTQTYWYRCRSKFYHTFNFALYPFDTQTLHIKLESPDKPLNEFRFEVMPASHLTPPKDGETRSGMKVLPEVSGWLVSGVRIYTDTNTYQTDWGFPRRADMSTYSQAVLEIRLRHRWAIPLLALLGPNLLSALLAALVAGSKHEVPGRMQALLGIIAAIAAQHYAFMTNAPGVSILRFAHIYFGITYAVLGLCVWFGLAQTRPLPDRYVWRWVLCHVGLTAAALLLQLALRT